jgi:hypothetical protein
LVQFADDEEPEPAALAFFASRFSFSDLLAAVFELFERHCCVGRSQAEVNRSSRAGVR